MIRVPATLEREIATLESAFLRISTKWDGRTCITEMRGGGSKHWKQLEWIGFYGEMLVANILSASGTFRFPGDTYGNTTFDFKGAINWDVKVHPNSQSHAILNGKEAMDLAVDDYDYIGLVVLCVDCKFDDDGSFKIWHDQLKGKITKYEKERIKRGAKSRRRKVSVELTHISIVLLNNCRLNRLDTRQEHWRNADGSPRRAKYSITQEEIGNLSQQTISH